MKAYFELLFLQKEIINRVDLQKYELSIPRPINLESIESSQTAQLGSQPGDALSGNPINLPDDQLYLSSGSTDITQTFSYLGEQLWNFISFYNYMSQNNNFEAFSSYMGMIPGLIGLDPQLPTLKKKHFKQLEQQLSSNIYQFQQIIVKVFVETCLQELSDYMRDVYQMLHQFDKMKENFQRIPDQVHQEIKTYIDSILNEIQNQYDLTVQKLRCNWGILKEKL